MALKELLGGLGVVGVLALYAIAGALGAGTTAIVVSVGLLLLGFVSIGTAQAIFLTILGVGATVTFLAGVLQLLFISKVL